MLRKVIRVLRYLQLIVLGAELGTLGALFALGYNFDTLASDFPMFGTYWSILLATFGVLLVSETILDIIDTNLEKKAKCDNSGTK